MCENCENEVCWCEDKSPFYNKHEEPYATEEDIAAKKYEMDWQWAIEENQFLSGVRM